MAATQTNKAASFYAAINEVDIASIAVITADRCIPRKVQAMHARNLFRSLGLKGISVTTPNYSMAQSVRIELPEPDADDDTTFEMHRSGNCIPATCYRCLKANARKKIEAILAAAFPSHDDRSDSMTDYFDYCWTIS